MSPYHAQDETPEEEEEWPSLHPHRSIELNDFSSADSNTTFVAVQPINRIAEIELVHRLDKRLLLFAMLGTLVKTLDNTNLGSAFISGMEEELNVTGLQYNYMNIIFMVGYLSMQIPSNILLSNMRPSRYLPTLEIIWCLLTIAMACVQSVRGVYIIRFALGLAEAGFYPGIVFLLGTWYTKRELGKRMALLSMCSSFGSGLSGIIQAVLLKTADGFLGISGWRWMFIFDASFTIILAYSGYHFLPDYPHNTDWLDKSESALALRRLGTDVEGKRGTSWMEKMKALMKNKYLYPFAMGWAGLHVCLGAKYVLGIVAKKSGYDAVTANLVTTPDTLITMMAGLINGFVSDKYRNRIWCIIIPALVGLVGMSLLSFFVQPFPFLYIGFLLADGGLGSLSSIVMTWASETISSDGEIRAMAIAFMNTSSSSTWIWTSLLLWPVTDAPYYHRGFTASVFLIIVFILLMISIAYMKKRDGLLKKAGSDNFSGTITDPGFIPLLQTTEEEEEQEANLEEDTHCEATFVVDTTVNDQKEEVLLKKVRSKEEMTQTTSSAAAVPSSIGYIITP